MTSSKEVSRRRLIFIAASVAAREQMTPFEFTIFDSGGVTLSCLSEGSATFFANEFSTVFFMFFSFLVAY